MKLTPEIRDCIDRSVLCWLATVSAEGIPNVSPKEAFTYFEPDEIIVANIASPQTVQNLQQHPNVCISFIDVMVQKGFQTKGTAEVLGAEDPGFADRNQILQSLTKGKFPFTTLTKFVISSVKPIIAPSYYLYPETTEEQQIASSRKSYGC